MASDLRVEATAGWVAADGMETAARLLVEQGVDEHSVGSLTILAAARRSGLGPADAVALALEVKSVTKGARLMRHDEEGFAAYAAREPAPEHPTLRTLLPRTGWHAREVWWRLADVLGLGRCRCGRPRDDGRWLQCDGCRGKTRRRVTRHRNAERKAARASRYRTPGLVGDEASRRAQRWRERVRSGRLPKLTPEQARALRAEGLAEYAPDGCACGETDERVLHLHHPDERGHYWRKVAGGSHIRELLQLRMDGWPRWHLVALCWACHAEVHGSVEEVGRQRARMERAKGSGNSPEALQGDRLTEYTRVSVTRAAPSGCSIHQGGRGLVGVPSDTLTEGVELTSGAAV